MNNDIHRFVVFFAQNATYPLVMLVLQTGTDNTTGNYFMNLSININNTNIMTAAFIDSKWNFMQIGYSQSDSVWYWNVNGNFNSSDSGFKLPHFNFTRIFTYLNLASTTKDVRMNEIQFWNLTHANISLIQNFYNRYGGLNFRYYNQGFFINSGSLINVCYPTERFDVPTQKCVSCIIPCFECSFQDETSCFNCVSGYQLMGTQCINLNCPKGQYYSTVSSSCVNCVSPCTTCITSTQCLYCLSGYYYVENGSYKCIANTASCPNGTYLDPNGYPICRSCPLRCSTCTSQSTCVVCESQYMLSNGQCYSYSCQAGNFYNTNTSSCQSCPANCANCNSAGQCTKCNTNSFLDTTQSLCVSKCLTGYYADAQSNVCMLCQPDCLTCVGNNYTCTSCSVTTYLFNQSCVQSCPIRGYFADTTKNLCSPCDSKCVMCWANSTDCTVCQTGYLLWQRSCLSNCPAITYASNITSYCYSCDISCSVCSSSLSSDCTKCSPNYFLYGTTCLSSCPSPYFSDTPSGSCLMCPYFCNSCTKVNNCQACKPGYPQISGNCSGEYFFRSNANQALALPINTQQMPTTYNLTALTVEVWLRMDDNNTQNLEVILGMTPYKLRKKSSVGSLHLSFQGLLVYCETQDQNLVIYSKHWYHFAYSLNSIQTALFCYLNGSPLLIGSNPMAIIATQLTIPTELTVGGTVTPKGSETNFVGYIKEFRFWNVARSPIAIANGMNYDMSSKSSLFFAYWKLNEKNDGTVTTYTDYSSGGTTTFNPSTIQPSYTVMSLMQFREVYLKICPQGQYAYFDNNLGYYLCGNCDSSCLNCIGPNKTSCAECSDPYKLVLGNFTCMIISGCAVGQYQDPDTGLCFSCNSACKTCSGSPNFCQVCNQGFFREYQGTGCVPSCPNGMYGSFAKQICLLNPIVNYILPANESVILFGTFTDLSAGYSLLNNEPSGTYSFGWTIIMEDGMIDVSYDAVKPYYETDMTRVHLDNNIIESDNYYYVTFWVKGDPLYYTGMNNSLTNYIFFGSPPTNGKCKISPLIGIATITKFLINQDGWLDPLGIDTYNFFFSMDSGQTFLPMVSSEFQGAQMNYTFSSTYNKYTFVQIKCQATNTMGFQSQVITSITLEQRSNADASNDLISLNPVLCQTETDVLMQLQQLKLISESLGSLTPLIADLFDPKISSSLCTASVCNNQGNCIFIPYTKKYYCNCTKGYGGQNCTFSNSTQISVIQNKITQLGTVYLSLLDNSYQFEYMKLITAYKEQLNDIIFAQVIQVLNFQIDIWNGVGQSDDDIDNYLGIVSNLLEYIEHDVISNNITNLWNNSTTKIQTVQENFQSALLSFDSIRQNSLSQIDNATTSKQFITRMIAVKQVLLNQDTLITESASNYSNKNDRTMVQVSPVNFQNTTAQVEYSYILELIEHALNPYQLQNDNNIATNILQTTIYNLSTLAVANISNLTNGILFQYPYSDNQNLTDFMVAYNSLSPYKAVQNLQRQLMLNNSDMGCRYWDQIGGNWSTNGCKLGTQDNAHIKCICNHLTAIAPSFVTPLTSQTQTATSSTNQYTTATDASNNGDITIQDLQVPINNYFKNLQELLQHKQPNPLDLLIKPGPYVVLIFWMMYISSLVYYTGRDRKRRYQMTKSQNRDDLAEIKDQEIQQIDNVIQDLIQRDYAKMKKLQIQNTESPMNELFTSPSPIEKKQTSSKIRLNLQEESKTQELDNQSQYGLDQSNTQNVIDLDQKAVTQNDESDIKIQSFEELTPDKQKQYRRKAKKKVFGRVGNLNERAERLYNQIHKKAGLMQEHKMKFFYEALKSSLWMGLMSKTSKIAPRHVRLALLYLYVSIHLTFITITYILGYVDQFAQIVGMQLFSMAGASIITLMVPWVICIPVALIFRMPFSLRQQVQGVRTKKVNKVFKEIDSQMGFRYAFGYFICYTFYILSTIMILFFNYFYPSSYCMSWLFQLVLIYIFDFAFIFIFAGMQLTLSLLINSMPCFYSIWAFFEKLRYIKNMRG